MKLKKYYPFSLFILVLLVSSCSSDDSSDPVNELQGINSQICANVQGPTAAYWDYSHALPIPLTQVPIVQNPGQQFIHSRHPLIGFVVPQGYTATEVTNLQTSTLGVNVLRNDNAVVWRYVPITSVAGQVAINSIMANEINQMFNFYGFNGTPDVVCTTTTDPQNLGSFITQFSARLLRFNGITAVVWVRLHFSPITGFTSFAASVSSAPTNEFDREVVDTFLPISWQLLVGPERGEVDNDGDGFPATTDPDDNDPDNPVPRG